MTARPAPQCAPAFTTNVPGTVAPSSLDRLLERVSRALPGLGRASEGIMAGTTALYVLVDLAVWATDPEVDHGRLPVSIAIAVPLIGVVAVALLVARRRHRARSLVALASLGVGLTIATAVIGTGLPSSSAVSFALAVMTVEALRYEPGGRAVALASLSGSAMAAEAVRPMVPTVGYLLAVYGVAFAVEVSLGVYLRWIDWRRVMSVQAARDAERLEIARELHDLVGHYVTGIVVQAQAAQHVAERRPDAAVASLASIERAGGQAMDAMRRMVGGLRADAPSTPAGSWDELDRLLDDAAAQGVPLTVEIDPLLRTVAPALAPSVHRIVAESLTNVRRHARGVGTVDVSVHRDDTRVVVTVRDDGEAAAATGHHTYGIVGMRERAESLGGSLLAGPAAGGGWQVRALLPMEEER